MRVEGVNYTKHPLTFPLLFKEENLDFLSVLSEALKDNQTTLDSGKTSNESNTFLGLVVFLPLFNAATSGINSLPLESPQDFLFLKGPTNQDGIHRQFTKMDFLPQQYGSLSTNNAATSGINSLPLESPQDFLFLKGPTNQDGIHRQFAKMDFLPQQYGSLSTNNAATSGINSLPLESPQDFLFLKGPTNQDGIHRQFAKMDFLPQQYGSLLDFKPLSNFTFGNSSNIDIHTTAILDNENAKEKENTGFIPSSATLSKDMENSQYNIADYKKDPNTWDSKKDIGDQGTGEKGKEDLIKHEIAQSTEHESILNIRQVPKEKGKLKTAKDESLNLQEKQRQEPFKEAIHITELKNLEDNENVGQVQQKNVKAYEPIEHKYLRIKLDDADISIRIVRENIKVGADLKWDMGYIFWNEINKLVESLNHIGFRLEALQVNGTLLYSGGKHDERKEERNKPTSSHKGDLGSIHERFEISI